MSNSEMRAFYQRYVAAANTRDFQFIASIFAEDVSVNGVQVKRADVIAGLTWLVDAVPDLVWHLDDLVVEDDRLAAKLRDKGTPTKEFLGFAPNGAQIEFAEYTHYKVKAGLFVEMWYMLDTAEIAKQLNASTA